MVQYESSIVLMYQVLAEFYDELVKDDSATALWVDFVVTHGNLGNILEVAAGTGEISIALAKKGYQVLATDLSENMLALARQKPEANLVSFQKVNLLEIDYQAQFDNVICFCDSLNYLASLQELEDFFNKAYLALKNEGKLLFDILSKDRLKEFLEPFIEEGKVSLGEYQWVIETHQNTLQHHFTFWVEDKILTEVHQQIVFDIFEIQRILKEVGFTFKVYTDFTKSGINEGERYLIVAQKKL